MKVGIFNTKGERKEEMDVKSEIFKITGKEKLISEVVVSYLSNQRAGSAKTKTRSEVSGGGKKPWKQKGTGRARTGSIRNPLFRGGGIIFGPTGMANFAKKINIKKRRGALRAALALKKSNEIIVIEKIDLKTPKTKEAAQILKSLPVNGKVGIIYSDKTQAETLVKSFRNIPGAQVVFYQDLNALTMMYLNTLVFVGDTFKELVKFLEEK